MYDLMPIFMGIQIVCLILMLMHIFSRGKRFSDFTFQGLGVILGTCGILNSIHNGSIGWIIFGVLYIAWCLWMMIKMIKATKSKSST